MKIFIPPQIKKLAAVTGGIFAVGGYVRNSLLSLPPADIDICGALTIEQIRQRGFFVTEVNKKLGTGMVSIDGITAEYTPFREELYSEGGCHTPAQITLTDSLFKDALRRDFTVNSIYYDIKNEIIIDPLNGLDDLKNRLLRAFDPPFTFKSDGLRLMRLIRLAAELGFEICPKTFSEAKSRGKNLADISPERKRDELNKILLADEKYKVENAHYRALRLIGQLGLWKYILPCMEIMEVGQNPKYHKYDVLEHSLTAVKFAPPFVRLAALMHDTGKPVIMARAGNSYGHAEESGKIAKRELTALRYPAAVVSEVSALCRLHMYDLGSKTSDSKMLIFAAENFALIDKLEALSVADKKATGMDGHDIPRFAQFKNRLIESDAPLTVSGLKINGDDAVAAGLKGSEIKDALKQIWRFCVVNPRLNERDRLLKMLNNYQKQAQQ